MNGTSVFPILMAAGWVAISNLSFVMRGECIDKQKAWRTVPVDHYIPLH
jgi:hypothetical protein